MNHWKSSLFVAALCIAVAPLAAGQAAPADAPRTTPAPAVAPASADRAFLGVYIGSENDGGGVKVEQVEEGSPAAKAGLQAGDVITALGDRTIGSEEELRATIASHQVGEKLRVTFLRDGEKRRTSARLAKAPAEGESVQGEAPAERKSAEKSEKPEKSSKRAAPAEPKAQPKVEAGPPAGGGDGGPAYLGVRLAEDDQGRTTVSEVVEGSPAEKAGIKAGDVILAIDADETGSADDVVKLVQSHHAGDRVTVALERDGAKQKIKLKLGAKDAAAAAGPAARGAGGGTIAVPSTPKPPEPVQPPAGSQPAKLRGRVAAPADADAAGADAVKKEFQALRAELEKTRREMEDLRRKCEAQQRTLEAIKRALGGGEPGSTSMAAPDSSPGGDESAVISISAGSSSMGTTEIAVAPATAAGGDCCAVAGTGTAVAGDCCAGCDAATGVQQIVVSDGSGDEKTIAVANGQTIALKDGQLFFAGEPLTTKDFVIECEGDGNGAAPKVFKLGGQVDLKLDDDGQKDSHGQMHGGVHALTLKPTGRSGTFEFVLEGDEGNENGEECCEGCEGGEKSECCEEEENEKGGEGGQTIVLQLADDGHGGRRVVHQAALGGTTQKQAKTVMKGAPAPAHAFAVKPLGVHDLAVMTDGGKGSCEGGCCCCCEGKTAPAKIEFKAATGMVPPKGAPAAGLKPPARARSMSLGGMGGMPGMALTRQAPPNPPTPRMPRMPGMPRNPGMPAGAHKVDNGGGMELMQLLHGGGTFTWKCDGPCEFKIGPGGVEFHCQGSCEISRAGGPESVAAQPGAPALFRLIGAGTGGERSESSDGDHDGSRDDGDDDDDDDDDAPAAQRGHGRVF